MPGHLAGFHPSESSNDNSKLTATNLEYKKQMDKQASPQPQYSGHLESIAESSMRDDPYDSETASCPRGK